MQTHPDYDANQISNDLLLNELKARAKKMMKFGENLITAGAPGETPIREWSKGVMEIKKMPDDPQGVLRISVGGGVGFDYCVFRGSQDACRTLLKQAWQALERP